MFILDKSDTYYWPVKTTTPSESGKFEEENFEVLFKRISEKEKAELIGQDATIKTDIDICHKIVKGWKGVKDSEGNDIPFTHDNLDKLLQIPKVASYVVISFLESITGARVKN